MVAEADWQQNGFAPRPTLGAELEQRYEWDVSLAKGMDQRIQQRFICGLDRATQSCTNQTPSIVPTTILPAWSTITLKPAAAVGGVGTTVHGPSRVEAV